MSLRERLYRGGYTLRIVARAVWAAASAGSATGISQPYVVRMFGTKENLFLEAMDRAMGKLFVTFRAVISEYDAGRLTTEVAALEPSMDDTRGGHLAGLMGRAYADLIQDRGILLLLMQSFVSGHEPVIGPRARDGFLALYELVRDEAGLGAQHASDFLAQGMLMNTLISLRMPELFDSSAVANDLLKCTMKTKLDVVLAASQAHPRIS